MRHRPLVLPATGFLVGTVLAGHVRFPPFPTLFLVLLLLILVVRRRRQRLFPLLLFLSFIAAGASVRSTRSRLVPANHLDRLLRSGWRPPDHPIPVSGTIRRPLEKTFDGHYLYVDLEGLGEPHRPVRGRIRLTVPPPADGLRDGLPEVGDRIRLHARLRTIRPFRNPGAYDYRAHMAREGISLQGSVKSVLLIRRTAPARNDWTRPVHRFGRWCESAVEAMFPGNPRARGIFKAILLGRRREIPAGDQRLLQESGLYHLVAISGLHVGFWLWGWWWVLGRLRIPGRAAAGLGLPLLPVIPVFFGGRHSVQRAVLMAAPLLAGRCLSRRTDLWNALALSCLVALVLQPAAVGDVGFQLSYGATAAILFVGRRQRRRSGLAGAGGSLLAASIAAQAATFPLTALHFHRFTPIAIVLNLVAVPAVAGLLGLGCAGLVGAAVHPPAVGPIALVMEGIAHALFMVIRIAIQIPGASFRVLAPPVGLMILYYLVLIAAIAVRTRSPRRIGLVAGCLPVAAALMLVGHRPAPEGRSDLRLTVFDVGQGDAILLDFPGGRRVLIDGGGFLGRSFDIGENVVSPALWMAGVDSIDAVAGTHAQRDHIGGLAAILRNFPVREFWPPPGAETNIGRRLRETAAALEIPVRSPRRGDRIWMGGVCIDFLHPPPGPRTDAGGNPNNVSLVMLVRFGTRAFLLTGDIERSAERLLIEDGLTLAADVLKVPHHGGRGSSRTPFLRRVAPRVAVISVGRTNPWGHPAPEVLRRLRRVRAAVFRTDLKGAITLESDGCRLAIRSFGAGDEIEFPCRPIGTAASRPVSR